MMIHHIHGVGFSGNIFLLDAERPCLIDTGWDPDITHTGRQVGEILAGRKLAYIILTHRHIDHVGGASAFQQRFGGEILAHELDAEALKSGDMDSTGARLFGGRLSPLSVKAVKEGNKIELGDGDDLEVLHTPGHTIGSMCLLTPDAALFSGDTVFSGGSVGRWDLETGNYEQLLASVERLAALDIQSLYPGHESPVEGDASDHLALSLKYIKIMGRFG